MKLSLQKLRDATLYGAGTVAVVYEFFVGPFLFGKQPNLEIVALGFGALGLPEFLARGDRRR